MLNWFVVICPKIQVLPLRHHKTKYAQTEILEAASEIEE